MPMVWHNRVMTTNDNSIPPSVFRETCPSCPAFGRCGGCQLLDVPYAEQLAAKQRRIEELLAPLAAPEALRPILGMAEPFHYRNKVITPYAPARQRKGERKGKGGRPGGASGARDGRPERPAILTGMYERGTHRLIPTDECLIENRAAKGATLAIRDIMARHGMEPYDEDAHAGFVRHAVARAAQRTGELLVTLVTNGREFAASKAFCRELKRRVPEVVTVVQNVNTRQTNAILGDEERVLYGPGFILDELCGLTFRISSQSFYQVNAVQAEVLYDAAVALAALDGTQAVLDAYCGTGTIGLVAAARGAARVTGVDAVAPAIADARLNARHNGIANAEFVAADATAFMAQGAARGLAAPGQELVVMMDPPRAGSTERFLRAAAALAPARIVYVSCNPDTQARDARVLAAAGYRITAAQPVDMFPHTPHIECICRFEPERP